MTPGLSGCGRLGGAEGPLPSWRRTLSLSINSPLKVNQCSPVPANPRSSLHPDGLFQIPMFMPSGAYLCSLAELDCPTGSTYYPESTASSDI